MSYYPEPDNRIRDEVKVVIELSNYATNKELGHFIALKAGVDELDTNKPVPTSLNNLKAKVDDLDAGKLKTVPVVM